MLRVPRLNPQCLLPIVHLLALPLYWLIGRHLAGLGPIMSALFAVASPFAIHTVKVGIGFFLSYRHQHERPGIRHSRPRDWLIAFPREAAESIRQFYWLMPFRADFAAPEPAAPAARRLPILLIHGYGCNRGLWLPAARWFSNRGHHVSAINLSPMHGSIDGYAESIGRAVAALRAHCGTDRIAVVGHSMGGLAARAYLRRCTAKGLDPGVAMLITLGTPHHGTHLARLGFGLNARQMHFGSRWLDELARDEAASNHCATRDSPKCRVITIGSLQDNIVTRPLQQRLPGARTILVRRQGHMSLVTSHRILRLLDRLLARG